MCMAVRCTGGEHIVMRAGSRVMCLRDRIAKITCWAAGAFILSLFTRIEQPVIEQREHKC